MDASILNAKAINQKQKKNQKQEMNIMAEKINAAIIDQIDTVAVAIEKISAGETVTWRDRAGDEHHIVAKTDIPIFHKVAIVDMPKGSEVVKYGQHIGLAACDIHVGEHVHVHNVQNHREQL